MRLPLGAAARILRWALLAFALAALAAGPASLHAHEGHDHADKSAAEAGSLASPRVVAVSESYQFVGIVEGEVLVVYLDRAADNAPGHHGHHRGLAQRSALQSRAAEQRHLRDHGADPETSRPNRGSRQHRRRRHLRSSGRRPGHRPDAGASAARATRTAIGDKAAPRRRSSQGSPSSASSASRRWRRQRRERPRCWRRCSRSVLAAAAVAHDGHDHGADSAASGGNSPQRRPDGTIFLPKPSQRLLDVRTSILADRNPPRRAVRLAGRVAANPNFSGVVQSTIPGRYEAPAGGVPPLGARVKAGEPLGKVTPAFASIDSSDMAQTLGDIEQKLSIARAKLARQEQLLRTNVVASRAGRRDAHGGRGARQAPHRPAGRPDAGARSCAPLSMA